MASIRDLVIFAFTLVVGVCVSIQPANAQSPDTRVVAFLHASVVPMDRERIVPDQTVVVADGKIVAIGPAATLKPPANALHVEAVGRYLLPALSDMHVHLLGESWNAALPPGDQRARKDTPFEDFLFPYVAMGVTTVQELLANEDGLEMRKRIAEGGMIGPRIILARMIDAPRKAWPPPISVWVETPAEAREAVRRAKAEGYDKIKVYSFLSKESYDAIVATAKELKMEVMGHVPISVSVEYIVQSGQKAIAHTEEVAKHAAAYDAENVERYARLLTQSKTWMIPTLVTSHNFLDFFDNPDGIYRKPGAEYFRHPMQRGVWKFMVDNLYGPIPAEQRQKLRDAYVNFQRPLTKSMHAKGAKLLAGSDTIIPGLVAGFALHSELREYVDVGLTPYEALKTATVHPAEYLGESDKAGTIAIGKQTDLLLVDENPLKDISAASKVAGVLMRGRWIDGAEIRKKMEAIAAPRP